MLRSRGLGTYASRLKSTRIGRDSGIVTNDRLGQGINNSSLNQQINGDNRSSFIQKRYFFFQSFNKLMNLKKLRDGMEGTSDENKKVEYLRALTAYAPRMAMQQIERGWEGGKLPISEPVLREYLKAAAGCKRLDAVNISALLTVMRRQSGELNGLTGTLAGEGSSGGLSSKEMLSLLSSSSSSTRFTAGSSPTEPLFIATQEPSWRTQAWKFLRSYYFHIPTSKYRMNPVCFLVTSCLTI